MMQILLILMFFNLREAQTAVLENLQFFFYFLCSKQSYIDVISSLFIVENKIKVPNNALNCC
jgi:hypothetical protein